MESGFQYIHVTINPIRGVSDVKTAVFQYIHLTINLDEFKEYIEAKLFQYIHVTINQDLHLIHQIPPQGFNTSMLLLIPCHKLLPQIFP